MKGNQVKIEWPLFLHPNYCEDGQTLEEYFALGARLGVDGLEIRRSSAEFPDPDAYADALAGYKDRYRIPELIVGAPAVDLCIVDGDERERAVDRLLEFYGKIRSRCGLRLVNLLTGLLRDHRYSPYEVERHGSALAHPYHWSFQVAGLKRIARWLEENGVRAALETHPSYLHDLPGPTAALIGQVGSQSLGALLDYGNLLRWQLPPTVDECLGALRGRIFYLHLKNVLKLASGEVLPCALEDGIINHRKLLRQLKRTGYDGPICIEGPRPGDGEHFASRDLAYLRSLLSGID